MKFFNYLQNKKIKIFLSASLFSLIPTLSHAQNRITGEDLQTLISGNDIHIEDRTQKIQTDFMFLPGGAGTQISSYNNETHTYLISNWEVEDNGQLCYERTEPGRGTKYQCLDFLKYYNGLRYVQWKGDNGETYGYPFKIINRATGQNY